MGVSALIIPCIWEITQKRADSPLGGLCAAKFCCPPSTDAHDKIGTTEENMKPVHIFCNASISYFGITEVALDNQERVLHLAAH